MKKQDLKTGMLVQYRCGDFALLINGTLVSATGFMFLSWYDDNLKCLRGSRKYDLVKVTEVLEGADLMQVNQTKCLLKRHLLWERNGMEYTEKDMLSFANWIATSTVINKDLSNWEEERNDNN